MLGCLRKCVLKLPHPFAAQGLQPPLPSKLQLDFPGVSGGSGDLMAIREGSLWEGLGAVWFERDLTLMGVCGHSWGGKPCCTESLSSLASTGSGHLPWEVSAITEFL